MIYSRGEINARSALQHPPGGFHPPPLQAGSAIEKSNKTIDFFRKVQSIEFLNKVMKKKGDRKHLLVCFALIERYKIFSPFKLYPLGVLA